MILYKRLIEILKRSMISHGKASPIICALHTDGDLAMTFLEISLALNDLLLCIIYVTVLIHDCNNKKTTSQAQGLKLMELH